MTGWAKRSKRLTEKSEQMGNVQARTKAQCYYPDKALKEYQNERSKES